jgi:hypothetical protein
MKVMKSAFILALVAGLSGALAARAEDNDKKYAAAFEELKKLAGDWVLVENGKPTDQVASSIKVTAGGSTVSETLFPGAPHEMLTVYYMEGNNLMLTHYCMLANQPRLKASAETDAKKLVFKFDGGSNIKPEASNHMHDATITLVDKDHIKAEWTRCDKGAACETKTFELARKTK